MNRICKLLLIGVVCLASSAALGQVTVIYDAFGRPVEIDNSSTKVNTEIVYAPEGKAAAYMNGSTLNFARVPMPGGGTYEYAPGVANYLIHKDWLGNSRLVSTLGGHTMTSDLTVSPYGEMAGVGMDSLPQQEFTGSTQDLVQGLFDTPNREYASTQGRWLSPDPAHSGWNLYAYSTNPLGENDPSGLGDQDDCDYNGSCGAGWSANLSWSGSDTGLYGWEGNFDTIGMVATYDINDGSDSFGAIEIGGGASSSWGMGPSPMDPISPDMLSGTPGIMWNNFVHGCDSGTCYAMAVPFGVRPNSVITGFTGGIEPLEEYNWENGTRLESPMADAAFNRLGTHSVAETLGVQGQYLQGEALFNAVQNAQRMVPGYQAQFVSNDLQVIRGVMDLNSMGIEVPAPLQEQWSRSVNGLNIWLQWAKW